MTENIRQPCRLCLEDKELRRSHIFPEFFYRPMYEDGLIYTASLVQPAPRRLRKGLRERLLCGECENLLNRGCEDYASKVFAGEVGRVERVSEGLRLTEIDYQRFKTFQVSLLWRASISRLDFFDGVNLGPHEEKIRSGLLDGRVFEETEYGCAMFYITDPDAGVMTSPERARVSGTYCYVFVLGGFLWVFVVSRHAIDSDTRRALLHTDGSVLLPFRSLADFPAFGRTAGRMVDEGRLEGIPE